jgi:hypothetical protein
MENKLCRCGKPATFVNQVRAFCEPCRIAALENWNREAARMNNRKQTVRRGVRGRKVGS